MDFVWDLVGADNRNPSDEALTEFYNHPIWLLNGLFIEKHTESLRNRDAFADWVASKTPFRVADFGGGYGTLARKIATRCPGAHVHIVDPYPRPESKRANATFNNLAFSARLDGTYDVIVATDVFEHVTDPLGLLFVVAHHVRPGGYLLTANHFAPSIKCHLPRTFHFHHTWDLFMALAGFRPSEAVIYGQSYRKEQEREINGRVRRIESLSANTYRLSLHLPALRKSRKRLARFAAQMV